MTDPLHDPDAELCTLALALQRPDEAFKSRLRPEHFSQEPHRIAWVSLRDSWDQGARPSPSHVIHPDAKQVLENLDLLGVTPLGPEVLVPRLESCRVRRQVLDQCDRVSRMAMNGADPEHLETALHSIQFRAPGAGKASRASDAQDVMDDLEWRMANPGQVRGHRVGLPRWEEHVDGLGTGYHVVAARPSQGKTALIVQMLSAMAEAGVPTLFLSLEMSAKQVRERILSRLCGFPVGGFREHPFTHGEAQALVDATRKLRDMKHLWIWDMRGANLQDWAVSRSIIRKAVRENQIQAAGLDYFQLLTYATEKKENRTQELTAISKELKAMAEQLAIPLLIAAQLRRPSTEHGGNKPPELSDIKDCGSVEQDADTVTMIHNYPDEHLILGKNRTGPINDHLAVRFDRECMQFVEEDSVDRTLRKKSQR